MSDFSRREFIKKSLILSLGASYIISCEDNDMLNNTDTPDSNEESGGTDIGTFTLDGQQEAIIQKDPSDQLFAANAAVMAVGVAINSN